MKKWIVTGFLFAFYFISAININAADLPDGWLSVCNQYGSLNMESTGFDMLCDTREKLNAPYVRAASAPIDANKKLLMFSFKFSADMAAGNAAVMQTALIYNISELGALEPQPLINLLKIRGTNLYAANDETPVKEILLNQEYTVAGGVDLENKMLTLYIDGERLTDRDLITNDEIPAQSVRLLFQNYYAPAKSYSDFKITDLKIETDTKTASAEPSENILLPDSLKKITVDFGTILAKMPAVSFKKAPMGSGLFEELEKDVLFNGTQLIITPKSEILYKNEYQVKISDITDFTGKTSDNISLSYLVAEEGYALPEVRLTKPASGETVREGEPVLLQAETYSTSEIQYVRFFADDELLAEVTAPPYEYSVRLSGGQKQLRAECCDKDGGIGECAPVTITVIQNALPVMTVEDIETDIDIADKSTVKVSAEDSDGSIESVSLFCDNLLIEKQPEAPYEFDLTKVGIGSHILVFTARDNDGGEYSVQKNVKIQKTTESVYMECDFSLYSGGDNSQSAVAIVSQGATAKAETIDAQHGKSLVFEVNGDYEPYLSYAYTTSERFIWCTDLYFKQFPSGGIFLLLMKSNSGSNIYDQTVLFSNGQMTFYNGDIANKTISLSTGQFYEMKYDVDFKNKTYSFYIDGVEIVRNFKLRNQTGVSLSQLRLIGGYKAVSPGSFAVDNFKIIQKTSHPYISGIVTGDGGQKAQFGQKQLTVSLSESMGRLRAGDFKLYDSIGEIDIISVTQEAEFVTLNLSQPLRPDGVYYAVLKDTAPMSDSLPVGAESMICFSTTSGTLGVRNVVFEQKPSLTAQVNLYNHTFGERTAVIIGVIYKNGIIKGNFAKSVCIGAGEDFPVSVECSGYEQGCLVRLHVIDSYISRKAISDYVYVFQ